MSMQSDNAGKAALSICEALLLALGDRGVLSAREIAGLLDDAAASHESASETETAAHRDVAVLIRGMIPAEPRGGGGQDAGGA